MTEAFQKLKSNLELNESFDDVVSQKHNAVQSVIENTGRGYRTQLIGSLQRKTRIQPREEDDFDIDILVELGTFYNWVPYGQGINPEDALRELNSAIASSDRYGAMGPETDAPTVSFEYKDGVKVELVPAYLDRIITHPSGTPRTPSGRAFWIPKNGRWELADYNYDAEYITNQNKASGGYVIPTIKMLKAIRRKYFPDMSPFHLEVIAAQTIPLLVTAYKQQGKSVTYPLLIADFFQTADSFLTQSITLPGSYSPSVGLPVAQQQTITNTIKALGTACTEINNLPYDTDKKRQWREVFDNAFPSV